MSSKMKSKGTEAVATSLNQWIDQYKITKFREEEYERLKEDPKAFGETLANTMIDEILNGKKSS